jgi:hypothetical protein
VTTCARREDTVRYQRSRNCQLGKLASSPGEWRISELQSSECSRVQHSRSQLNTILNTNFRSWDFVRAAQLLSVAYLLSDRKTARAIMVHSTFQEARTVIARNRASSSVGASNSGRPPQISTADWLEELAVYGTARNLRDQELAYQLSLAIETLYLVRLALRQSDKPESSVEDDLVEALHRPSRANRRSSRQPLRLGFGIASASTRLRTPPRWAT